METKARVLEAAIRLFNERGYASVSMRDIADSLGRSVGNLTYHFKKKADLVLAIVHRQLEELEGQESGHDVDLRGFDDQLVRMLAFQGRYSFYFTSMFELRSEYPEIASYQVKASAILVEHFCRVFKGFEDKGLFHPSQDEAWRRNLALGIVLLRMSWMQQTSLDGNPSSDRQLLGIIWAILSPNLTRKGRAAYLALQAGLD